MAAPVEDSLPTSDEEPGPPSAGGPFLSLRDRDFRLFWYGTVSVGFSQWGQQIGLNWLVFVLTGSAVQLGAVSFVGGVLALVLTPYAGFLADKYSRRELMVWSTAAGTVQCVMIAVLVLLDMAEVWHAYAFAVAAAITQAVNQPARLAYVNDISTGDTFTNAMALNSIAQNASRIVGPPLAGFIAAWSIGACFVFVAATRGLSLIYTMLLSRRTQAPNNSTENPVQQIVSGFRYLFSDIDLTLLLLLNALTALLVWPYVQFMPVFAEDVFGGNAQTYGWLVSMIAVGSIVGLFGLAWFPNVRYRGWIMLGSFIVYDALLIGFTQAPVLGVALATLATAGVFFGLASTLSHTFFQAMLRPDMRGRGLAALQVAVGLAPLGALPMGFLIDAIGIRNGVAIHFVLALTSMVIVTALGRSLRKL